ncbi:MAG: SRPBCC domain-containing protein [Mycobacteriales bacterium]
MPCWDPVSSRTFHLLTQARPEQVWATLTCPTLSTQFLHGLSAESTWVTDSPVHLTSPQGWQLTGRVLWSEPPVRLSLTIEDSQQACTYLTWELRRVGGASCGSSGTVVRLRVEESPAGTTDDEELEDAWLPALAALETVLRS